MTGVVIFFYVCGTFILLLFFLVGSEDSRGKMFEESRIYRVGMRGISSEEWECPDTFLWGSDEAKANSSFTWKIINLLIKIPMGVLLFHM